jgi:peroxiredoxin
MAETGTTFGIGDAVPAFRLTDTEGRQHALPAEDASPATVLIQTCNHCPYVIAWNPRLRAVAEEYRPRGVRFLAVNSNNPETHPADSPERMAQFVRDQDWPIPYAFDESQDVARALGSARTPEVFVLDGEQRLVYHGAPDADHADPSANAAWLRGALDAVLEGREVERAETQPRGCSVKWRR